jgi:hypothetical protein
MRVNPKQILIPVLFVFTLSGCGIVFSESPESWGSKSGSDGAKLWIEKQGSSVYPSSEGVASFCVTMGEEGQKRYDWTFEEQFASTEACTSAFVDGLK